MSSRFADFAQFLFFEHLVDVLLLWFQNMQPAEAVFMVSGASRPLLVRLLVSVLIWSRVTFSAPIFFSPPFSDLNDSDPP